LSLEVEDLTVTYTYKAVPVEKPSLRNVSFSVKKGERFGILGPTGSGKTTLSLCLNSLIPRQIPAVVKGKILVDGLDTKETPTSTLVQHLSLVFSDPELELVEILVEDDIAFGPSNLNLSIEEIQERVRFAIKACGLEGFEKRTTGDLSGGEMQNVAIAAVMAMRPPIMVLDEPITMLDPVGKDRVISVLDGLQKEYGTTMIYTESGNDIEYFTKMVDRIAVLFNGEILKIGTPQEIFTDQKLMKRIGIRPPQVTQLFTDLGVRGKEIPVTVEEAISLMRDLYKKRKIKLKRTKRKEATSKRREVEPIITVRNLHHVYPPNIHALKGIDLDIYPGERVGIIGQNGSGKTTLSYHLVGLLKPTNPDAKVIVGGIDATDKKTSLRDIIKVINYAFQRPDAQLSQETVWDEVLVGLKLMDIPAEEAERRAEEALKTFGIEDKKKVPIIQASLDLKRFTTISSLLALQPKILILDEPTNGLDYEGGKTVMETVTRLNKERGMTIITITHNMELIAEYTDRIIVIKDGKILMDGPTREVFSNPDILKEAHLYPPQVARLFQGMSEAGFPPDVLLPQEAKALLEVS